MKRQEVKNVILEVEKIRKKLEILEKQLINQSEGIRKQLVQTMNEIISNNDLIQQIISENYSIEKQIYKLQECTELMKTYLDVRREREHIEINEKMDLYLQASLEKGNDIKTLIDKNSRDIRADNERIAKSETKKRFDEIEPHFKYINDNLPLQTFYYNDFERKDIESFRDYKNRPDYKEKFLDLMKKLDPASRATIANVLKRQEMVAGTMGQRVYLYTPEEQKIIAAEKKKMTEILEIAEDCYCMDGYVLPINSFEMSVFFDKHGLGKIRNIEQKVKSKDIIDVGGYIGDSILIFSPLTEKKVYSFEAITSNFKLMSKTIQLNGVTNAVPIQCALGDKEEDIEFFLSKSCSSIHHPSSAHAVTGTETVHCGTLDSFVEKNLLDVGLIKVDIEGAEQAFLRGAKKTICKQKPILLISIYHNPDDFFDIKPMIESWNVGYQFQVHKPTDVTISREILLIAEV